MFFVLTAMRGGRRMKGKKRFLKSSLNQIDK